jgi:hypothetical protein
MEGTMRNRALAGSAGGVAGAAVGLPAFYLARRLRYEGFDPG